MEENPINRICPSDKLINLRKVSRHAEGVIKGKTPSNTSISPRAVNKLCVTQYPIYLAALPVPLKYLKNSELGSSTNTSLLLFKDER